MIATEKESSGPKPAIPQDRHPAQKKFLQKIIWPLLLTQNFTNLTYMFLALKFNSFILLNTGNPAPAVIDWKTSLPLSARMPLISLLAALAPQYFMVCLLRLCQPRFKAAHLCHRHKWADEFQRPVCRSFERFSRRMGLIFFIPLTENQKKRRCGNIFRNASFLRNF